MANVGVVVEQNLSPSCIYNKASETRDPIPQTDLRSSPDLLPYLKNPGITRKRSRKEKIITANVKNVAGPGRIHIQHPGNIAEESYLRQICQGNNKRFSAPISNLYKNEFENEAETLQRSEIKLTSCRNDIASEDDGNLPKNKGTVSMFTLCLFF